MYLASDITGTSSFVVESEVSAIESDITGATPSVTLVAVSAAGVVVADSPETVARGATSDIVPASAAISGGAGTGSAAKLGRFSSSLYDLHRSCPQFIYGWLFVRAFLRK